MGDFKLIGIKAEKKCSSQLSKVLEQQKIYYFYQEYFVDEKTDELTVNSNINPDLYSQDNVNINISAIAGKNGSGKSTVIELLFMIINNLSFNNSNFTSQLNIVKGLHASLYFKTDNFYKLTIEGEKYAIYKYNGYKISQTAESNFDFKSFFYTVGINYSQYALNSLEMGNWLDGLFHKNDAYQIPIVINPMRTEGTFFIKTENDLVNARLITNLVRPIKNGNIDFRKLGDNLIATKLNLSSNNRNILNKTLYTKLVTRKKDGLISEIRVEIKAIDLQIDRTQILNKLSEIYNFKYSDLKIHDYEDIINPLLKNSLDYLIYKLVNIAVTYPNFSSFFDQNNDCFIEDKFDTYLNELLIKDKSHIGFKIKQTLNFLKYQHYSTSTQSLLLKSVTKKIDNLIDNPKNNLTEENRIELLPPPIFKIEIVLEPISKDKNPDVVKFRTLSSGEKQLIYSVSSILYHLVNLDSVSYGIKYENINIVLDEIELYFHPEFQRKYIKYILDSISTVTFKSIKNINICFITHSPFILSDLPNSNIMFLELDSEKNKYSQQTLVLDNTFSANIHDLLANSFFLKNGFMGEFSIHIIKSIIHELDEIKIATKKQSIVFDKNYEEKLKTIKSVINLVGEPILKNKLIEMFNDSTQEYESIDEKVRRLESQLIEAKKEQANNIE